MEAGPSTSRRGSSLSPSRQQTPLRPALASTDILSPELPPTYHSLDTHERIDHKDKDTDRLLDGNGNGNGKGKRRSTDDDDNDDGRSKSRSSVDDDDDGELDALRLDLDHGFDRGHGMSRGETEEDEALRIASVDQRKALWWRNTLVTGLFICSWSVPSPLPLSSSLTCPNGRGLTTGHVGTFSRPCCHCTINGCSRLNITVSRSPYL